MTQAALVIDNLKKIYASGTEALKGVSLTVPAGDFFGLLGPNGAGKTTVLGIVTGLVNKTAGTVSVFGCDIDKEPEKAKAHIGLVGQEINFNPFEKPFDIVVNQAGYYGIPRSVAIPRAKKLLVDLGLGDKMTQKAMTLSGGMKRRLMIARALVHQPRFLILDEPTAGVDVELRRGMWEYLRALTKEGLTILLTTHYLEEAEQLCRHIAIINKGQIISNGSMKDILKKLKSETISIDLTQPVTSNALDALRAYGPKKVDDTTIEIEIGAGRGLHDAIMILDQHHLAVQSVRNKSGKLEEVFVKLINE
ncbi:MAG: ABC transporter ATP-binding protein [Gammaproteobacteria bacterium]|nr:ABC transporter ATP-binding protein [Gammaproteobacteria bacterium]